MNVRDAEQTIERCIRSAAPLVSNFFIIDTGSEDDTQEIVSQTTRSLGLPGWCEEADWQGHASNRSLLLDRLRNHIEEGNIEADYTLMLDADMELVIDGPLPELTADEYSIPIHDRALIYPLPLLTSTRVRFYYASVAHAYLACDEPYVEGGILNQLRLIDHGGGGNRPGKIERDRDLLALEVARNPDDRRSWFYLAQSFKDLDEVGPAIAAYKRRAELGGWDEEVYQARYQAGALLSEHVSAAEGMQWLLDAYKDKPDRAEALRVLANVANSVADKMPFPVNDKLFVKPSAYVSPPAPPAPPAVEMPPLPRIKPRARRKGLTRPKSFADISAIIVTRGNVDLAPILDTLPYEDLVIWNNAERRIDYKAFGRYAAIPEARQPFIYWQDDDVIFTRHAELLDAYEPGKLVTNMDGPWINGAGYRDKVYMQGAGSLIDSRIPAKIWEQYLAKWPWDDDALTEADFVFGTLVPGKVVDLGYEVRPFADDPDRLYQTPGQTERKWRMIARCLEMKAEAQAA